MEPSLKEIPVDQDNILAAAEAQFRKSDNRIVRVDVSGHVFWAKRPEILSWLNRLQKGPSQAAFKKEMIALNTMRAKGVPVPDPVFQSPEMIIFRDAGPTLERILRLQILPENERLRAHKEAALVLAKLHASGISHGRPLLRDICWDGHKITLLDFENYRESLNNLKGHAFDLVWFILSMYAQRNMELTEIDAAVSAYRAADTAGVWDAATRWAGRNRWLDWVTRPIQLRADPHAREYKAIPMMLDRLTDNRSEFPVQSGRNGS